MDELEIVWRPSPEELARSRTMGFMRKHAIADYEELVARSIADVEWFWDAAISYLGIPFKDPYHTVLDIGGGIAHPKWFDGGTINLSEVCVDRWARDDPERTALVAEREDGSQRTYSFAQLLDAVEHAAGALVEMGVSKGETVAVYLPMSAEAIITMLAIARIGAVFVPVFSGYGAEAVRARIEAAEPRVMVTADGYHRRGSTVHMKEVADEAIDLSGVEMRVLLVRYVGRSDTPFHPDRDSWWEDALASAVPRAAEPTASEDPVLLAYTSGTTGKPKGVVHVQGGLSVKLAVEGAFQFELGPEDRVMWMTDMGWIMGPWMVVAGLANGASVGCFDGAPDVPSPARTWQLVESMGITVLGISPTLIRALQPHGADLASDADLSTLRCFGSTGETWNPDPWWWLFDEVGGRRIPIINMSGGTEVGACFLSAHILQGIKPTSLGGPGLGMAMDVFGGDGKPLREAVGELVCTKPWPGMTRGFWGSDDRYHDTYWNRWDDVWVHGDWASIDADGFWFLHGRSDDTLNIAGKRIGPAEIESAVVAHPDAVMAAAVGIPHDVKGEAIAIFVVPAPGVARTDSLIGELSSAVTDRLGKSFRPAVIRLVDDLPRTRSAKIMRRVIRARALGESTGDLAGLENPDAVEGDSATRRIVVLVIEIGIGSPDREDGQLDDECRQQSDADNHKQHSDHAGEWHGRRWIAAADGGLRDDREVEAVDQRPALSVRVEPRTTRYLHKDREQQPPEFRIPSAVSEDPEGIGRRGPALGSSGKVLGFLQWVAHRQSGCSTAELADWPSCNASMRACLTPTRCTQPTRPSHPMEPASRDSSSIEPGRLPKPWPTVDVR